MTEIESNFQLVVVTEVGDGPSFTLYEGGNLIGRWDPDTGAFPEVDLEDWDQDCQISRKHAVITSKDEALEIIDLGSRNGTVVNRVSPVPTDRALELQVGDVLQFGSVVMKVARRI